MPNWKGRNGIPGWPAPTEARILAGLSNELPEWKTAQEIADEFDIAKGSVQEMLNNLEEKKLVVRKSPTLGTRYLWVTTPLGNKLGRIAQDMLDRAAGTNTGPRIADV